VTRAARGPAIDVLLPVRGARRTLPFALADVLAQRGVDVRIIAIVDGAAGDASLAWLDQRARREPRLLVLAGPGRGAGAALDVGLAAVRSDFFSHMEADDRCPPDRLARLHAALHPGHPGHTGLHGAATVVRPAAVVSRAAQFGARTPGMRRYLDWQNALLDAEAMESSCFLEIPALHQTGLYDTAAVRAIGGYTPAGPWPLDIDFWMRWFDRDRDVRRVTVKLPRVLYRWRQHAAQSTRAGSAGGTHSLEALRACKAFYLARTLGRHGRHPRPVLLLSTGRTLHAWHDALAGNDVDVAAALEWRPGHPLPATLLDAVRQQQSRDTDLPLVLAAYGMAPARARLTAALSAAGLRSAPFWIA